MDSYSLYQNKLTTDEVHPKVVAYYYKQWKDFWMPYHTHNSVEIMYVIEGNCIVDTADGLFSMKKSDFIVIDANASHRLIVDKESPCRMLNIEFIFTEKESFFPSIKELASENQALATLLQTKEPYIILKDTNDVYHTLKSLVLELDEKDIENDLMIHLLLSQLLIRIATLIIDTRDRVPNQTDMYMKTTIAYIHQHYDYDIKVKDIASAVNLHPGYLHRIFKNHMGCTVIDYLAALRVEKAKMLLANTDIPVIEIPDYIGINSRQYFSAFFKKHTGKTPVEFRNSIEAVKWDTR
jgi:AraC-like DNA-binding protein